MQNELYNQMDKILIEYLKNWKKEKEDEGFIPTIDLLIEELESNS